MLGDLPRIVEFDCDTSLEKPCNQHESQSQRTASTSAASESSATSSTGKPQRFFCQKTFTWVAFGAVVEEEDEDDALSLQYSEFPDSKSALMCSEPPSPDPRSVGRRSFEDRNQDYDRNSVTPEQNKHQHQYSDQQQPTRKGSIRRKKTGLSSNSSNQLDSATAARMESNSEPSSQSPPQESATYIIDKFEQHVHEDEDCAGSTNNSAFSSAFSSHYFRESPSPVTPKRTVVDRKVRGSRSPSRDFEADDQEASSSQNDVYLTNHPELLVVDDDEDDDACTSTNHSAYSSHYFREFLPEEADDNEQDLMYEGSLESPMTKKHHVEVNTEDCEGIHAQSNHNSEAEDYAESESGDNDLDLIAMALSLDDIDLEALEELLTVRRILDMQIARLLRRKASRD